MADDTPLTREQFETWATHLSEDIHARLQPENSARSTEWIGTWWTNTALVLVTGVVAGIGAWNEAYEFAQTVLGIGVATVGGVQGIYNGSRAYAKGKAGKAR